MKNKKYDMTMLYEFILLVAIIVLVALLVFQINQDARDDITDSDRTTYSVVNESVTRASILTGATFGTTYRDASCSVITKVYNGTGAVSIAIGNFTQTGCILTNSSSMNVYTATAFLISYSVNYAVDTNRYNATINNDTAVSKIPRSLKLLAIAIIFGAVLFVILKVIPIRKTSELTQ